MAVTLVRRRGRYVQVGLFGQPVAFDLDQVVYRELTLTGSNASTPPSWLRALDLLRSGQVQTAPLITHVLPVTAWEEALVVFESGVGVKTVFEPTG
jgi:L-iditol 2-dehydrogenase